MYLQHLCAMLDSSQPNVKAEISFFFTYMVLFKMIFFLHFVKNLILATIMFIWPGIKENLVLTIEII